MLCKQRAASNKLLKRQKTCKYAEVKRLVLQARFGITAMEAYAYAAPLSYHSHHHHLEKKRMHFRLDLFILAQTQSYQQSTQAMRWPKTA